MRLVDEIHEFWFGAGPLVFRDAWFEKDPAFDAAIRARFGTAVEAAVVGRFPEGVESPRGGLATVLLLDQFTRNIWRDTPRAFCGDVSALALASRMVEAGQDRLLHPIERCFAYLPFEHAETLPEQERSVALYTALAAENAHDKSVDLVDYAERHAAIIRRFGRFPHRNRILGRTSTTEESAFLAQPGSRF
jgi:uncharacterized protein (DUF924 family)